MKRESVVKDTPLIGDLKKLIRDKRSISTKAVSTILAEYVRKL